MGLNGFGVGIGPGAMPDAEPEAPGRDLQLIRQKLVFPRVEKVLTTTIASGTIQEYNTGRDMVNLLTITMISGTLYIYRGNSGVTRPQFPTWAFGAMSPINPVEITLPYRVHEFTLYASGADACFSMVLQATL
jgi:hypothetical protein